MRQAKTGPRFEIVSGTLRNLVWSLGVAAVVGSIFSLAEAEEIRYDKGRERDPFQPLVGPHAMRGGIGFAKDALVLEGIVYDQKKGSYAVIGGSIYREGESIDGAQLIKVFPDRVVLLQESEEMVIWVREEILGPSPKKETTDESR